ncbi:hypothetical protein IMSAGC018_00727 [Lachnospiraceae bacterium]|nr:hypothetical protein IMSAGC018_00727 [Lachnospiraceae bacterium]
MLGCFSLSGRQRVCRGEVTAYLSLVFILLMAFIGGIMESASIQLAKNYRRADTNRALECVFAEYQKELLEEYDIFALEGSYETGEYTKKNVTDRLDYYDAGRVKHEVEQIQFLTDNGCSDYFNQIKAYMEHKYGLDAVKDMLGMTDMWGQQQERAEDYAVEEEAWQKHMDGLLEESESELPQENNPIAYAAKLKKSPILTLVMPKEKAVSEKVVENENMLISRQRNQGYGMFTEAAANEKISSLLYGDYLLEHFSKFTDKDCLGVLDYELEYILAGKESDRENLEYVVRRLLLLRFVPNYAYIQTDSEMKAEAQTAAMALCTILAVPAITEAAEAGILLAWAYGEAIMDVRALLKGSKVPLAKSKESWQLQLSKLFILGTEEDQNEGRDDEHGLGYSDYLRMLLFLAKKDITALRSLGVIEQNMRKIHGQTYFRADYCISRIEISSVCDLRRGIQYKFRTCYNYN